MRIYESKLINMSPKKIVDVDNVLQQPDCGTNLCCFCYMLCICGEYILDCLFYNMLW